MQRFFIFLIVLFSSLSLFAQEVINVNHCCSFHGADRQGRIYAYDSDHDAEIALRKIMEYTGLPANFELKATNVPNAAAALQGYKRYIFYNQAFMQRISQNTQSDWTAYSILAHEIGHHLSGHTLNDDQDRHVVELQADVFSGYILYQMGASQAEALLAINELADEVETSTHPSKYDRKLAVIAGWNKAKKHFTKKPNFDPSVSVNKNYSIVEEGIRQSTAGGTSIIEEEHTGLSYSSPFSVNKVFPNITQDGNVGMKATVSVRGDNLSAGDYKCVAWYYDKDGQRLNDKNGKFKSGNDQVSAGADLQIVGDGKSGTCDIFIPYAELHQEKGFNESQFKLGLFKKQGSGNYERIFVDNNFTAFEYFNIHNELKCEVEYSRVELGKERGGANGLELIVNTNLQDMTDDEHMIVAWFYDDKGEALLDINQKFSSNGKVITYESFKYEGSNNMVFKLFIPYDEFHLPAGSHGLQYRLGIYRKVQGKLELVRKEKVVNSFTLFN